ncbi:MAG: PAS domain S-box protein [Bryobacterales bacterium]|nr:PAS domain S-box protein [Bryobacterales bacterium]
MISIRRATGRSMIGICLICAAAGVLLWLGIRGPRVERRPYRAGWQIAPPFQVLGADGKPAGLAIDLVREAARRRGIQLEWVQVEGNQFELVQTGKLDLAPYIALAPERLGLIYMTEPYMETEYSLLVRESSPHRKVRDLTTGTISVAADLVTDNKNARSLFPKARIVSRTSTISIVQDVCTEGSDAAFLKASSAIAALLAVGGCSGQPLRWIPVSERHVGIGIGATFAARAAADALREEIGAMAADGSLRETLGRWGYMPGMYVEEMEKLLSAKRRERWLIAGIVFSAFLLTLTSWQALRIRRERNRTRQAEQALRVVEHKLRLMADNLKEMVLAYDEDRKLIYANPAVEALTGYPVSELEARASIKWVHPDDQLRMTSLWEQLFKGASFRDQEYRLIAKDGTVKWATSTWGPILDETGRQIGVQGCEREITKRKLAEDALRESESRFRGLLENVNLMAAMYDVHGKFTFCNDYSLAKLGWTREELIGSHVTRILPPKRHARITRLCESVAQTGEQSGWSSQPTVLTKDGKPLYLEMSNVTLRDSHGKPVAVAALGVDVTEQHALQEHYLQAQKMESVGRLAGGVAHDFNNLLTVINGHSDMASKALPAGDPIRSQIQAIRDAGERAADLTSQLLAFSRKQVTQPRVLDLNAVVADSERMLSRLLGEDIELVTSLSLSEAWVNADPGQIHQILMNLAVNARDAMPGGGRLNIGTSEIAFDPTYLPDDPITIRRPCILLSISDTGTGIDRETLKHIFEPFFTTKGMTSGTGLGLSIVYGIVEQCKGRISVETEPGEGTTFGIYLPRVDRAAAVVNDSSGEGGSRGSEIVLLVEDQVEVRDLIKVALQSFGYEVADAVDGAQALAWLAEHPEPVHLLLTDVVLPRMNGRQLAAQVSELRPEIKVLYMSGYTDDVIVRRGVLDAGVSYLAKPFKLEALANKVREVLDAVPTQSVRV